MRKRRALTVVLLGLMTAAPVMARSLPDGGLTSQEVANILQEKGYKAQVTTDKGGDPMVRSASGGVDFLVLYYECKGRQRCPSIQFYAGFKKKGITPARIAEWNTKKRFGRAYLDDEFDPRVEMDVDLEHGATTEAVANDMERWVVVLSEFTKFIGW
jgi:Putative bacterial sensory transduction regulator